MNALDQKGLPSSLFAERCVLGSILMGHLDVMDAQAIIEAAEFVTEGVLHNVDLTGFLEEMGAAGVLQRMRMPQACRNAGEFAILPHELPQTDPRDRPMLPGWEQWARRPSAYLQPGAQRAQFGIMHRKSGRARALQPMDTEHLLAIVPI